MIVQAALSATNCSARVDADAAALLRRSLQQLSATGSE